MSAVNALRAGREQDASTASFDWPVSSGLTAVTVGRLIFVPIIIGSFTVSALVTTLALLLFIVADVYDGVLARKCKADGPARRALDSSVDRIAIDSCLLGAWLAGALPLPIFCALLARDLYLAFICHRMFSTRRVAIKADWLYRALNLSVAAWAIAVPFVSTGVRISLAMGVLAFSLYVAHDLNRAVRVVLDSAPRLRETVLEAGWLRRNTLEILDGESSKSL